MSEMVERVAQAIYAVLVPGADAAAHFEEYDRRAEVRDGLITYTDVIPMARDAARAAIEAMRPEHLTWERALECVPSDIMEGAMNADLLHFAKVSYANGYVDGRKRLIEEALNPPPSTVSPSEPERNLTIRDDDGREDSPSHRPGGVDG